MKKLLLLMIIVLAIVLIGSSVALADVHWIYGFRNNTTSTVNDLHVEVWQNATMTIPMNVTTATVLSPAGWHVDSITGNKIDMSGPIMAVGGTVIFDFITPGGVGTNIWTSGDWTLNGAMVGDANDIDVMERNVIRQVKARIPRSIKLTCNDDVDFGVIRPGADHKKVFQARVESNDNWDLYIGGQDVTPFRSLLGAGNPAQLLIGTSLDLDGSGNPIMRGMLNLDTVPVLQNEDWSVDSFFDITYEIDLRTTNPHAGNYRALLNVNAVQNY